jgi:hypothetical protein
VGAAGSASIVRAFGVRQSHAHHSAASSLEERIRARTGIGLFKGLCVGRATTGQLDYSADTRCSTRCEKRRDSCC